MTGVIRTIKQEKNYGFIRAANGISDYFFHRDDLLSDWGSLCARYFGADSDITVEFEDTTGTKGNRARNVRVL